MISIDGYGIGAAGLFAVTALASLLGLYMLPALIAKAVLRPYWLVRNSEYWRLISSGFVHANLSHLIFNLLTFYFFAFALERRIGTAYFLVLYALGLLLSNLGTCYRHRNDPDYMSLGASGAISAVLFAAILYFPTASLYIMFIPVPIPAPLFAVLYLAYSFYLSRQARGRINHDAHIGGALTGLAFVALTDPAAYGRLLAVVAADIGHSN
ncbi:MAG TPA: rhomboid family intramembrane serine protease [Steroidobacteraceae bacterium]|jgi:membrane associated rhomboid family serine protease